MNGSQSSLLGGCKLHSKKWGGKGENWENPFVAGIVQPGGVAHSDII